MNSIPGSLFLTNSTMYRLRATPPTSSTLPFFILARFRKSATLVAMTSERDRTMSALVASPLLSLCVQSLFIKTEQREDMWHTCAFSGIRSTSDSRRSIRPSCCLKNSPVPEAHLLPAKLVSILESLSIVYTTKFSPPRDTTASTLRSRSSRAFSMHIDSSTLFMLRR